MHQDDADRFVVDGLTVRILYDNEDPINPRKEWDNAGTMVCFHRNYLLGDKHSFSVQEAQDEARRIEAEGGIVLPLYLYDHSGITMRTSPFSCPWDSGQVGLIWITADKIRKEYGVKRITKTTRKKATEMLVSEVEAYDSYLTGECYGFIVEDADGEQIDSCWGFLGDIKYCREEATSAAKNAAARIAEQTALGETPAQKWGAEHNV